MPIQPPPTPQTGTPQGLAAVVPVLMPQAGNTMEEGTIVQWRVKVGDRVTAGQILCEIETDKATIEMEATDAGRLAKIVAAAGAVVPVKQPIAFLAENDADLAAWAGVTPAATANVPAHANVPSVAAPIATATATPERTESGRIKASPAARKLAAAKGIDLAAVPTGSGPQGRILSTDLAGLSGTSIMAATTNATAQPPAPGPAGVRRPMSKMRRAIALNLQTSKNTIPHFYVKLTIDADPLLAFYKAQKPVTGCTLNDILLLAVGRVVGEMPPFRSRVDGPDIVETPTANIGVAVSVPEGLVVPVVVGVHAMTLPQLAAETKRVVEAARHGKIENLGKGVFTISNMGMLGVEDFAAIINPPESGILAISALREAVLAKDGVMRAAHVMSLTLSVDHRVVDGAVAAQFMTRLRGLLEAPASLLAPADTPLNGSAIP